MPAPINFFPAAPDGNSVDIRWLTLDRISPHDWPKLENMLSADERERAGRFRFARDRHAYMAAHALARGILSEFAPRHPGAWRFAANPHGKPHIIPEARLPPLQFSISHTRGLVAVAVTLENDVGLDVEIVEPGRLSMDVASRFFAATEVSYLRQLPADRQQAALFAFWTLKEAYIKAVGLGLSIPLDAFSFALDPLAISFSPRQPDSPANWLFRRFAPSPIHAMALALRHAQPHRVRVNAHSASVDALLALSHQTDRPGNISRRPGFPNKFLGA